MIVVDTTVLVYAVGSAHPLRAPSRALLDAMREGTLQATTTVEVLQEFAHVHARRRRRDSAVRHARAFAAAFAPLVSTGAGDLERGLAIFARRERLGAFDAVLAAVALRVGAEALVSGDRGFAGIRGLRFVELGSRELDKLLG